VRLLSCTSSMPQRRLHLAQFHLCFDKLAQLRVALSLASLEPYSLSPRIGNGGIERFESVRCIWEVRTRAIRFRSLSTGSV
jgi:hypothetical protein